MGWVAPREGTSDIGQAWSWPEGSIPTRASWLVGKAKVQGERGNNLGKLVGQSQELRILSLGAGR